MNDEPLQIGASGPRVVALQKILGILPDGDFGPITEAAVKMAQRTLGLKIDGIVGDITWAAFQKLPPLPPPPEKPSVPDKLDVTQICAMVEEHKIARYNWPGRGRAPLGYTKGVAVSFACAVVDYRENYLPAVAMARAAPCSDLDALFWYADKFKALGMSNREAGEDTLRHLFVLLLGLGMRESSGKHCCGRDTSARNTTSDSAEAGAWQMSWDARAGVPLLRQQMRDYKGDGYLDIYEEGVSCGARDWRCWGGGTGEEFQSMCKNKPDFSAQACALGLRTLRSHWGPINRREVTLAPAADDMLQQVQKILNS